INVVSIKLPALRTMGRDLLMIAREIVKGFAKDFNKEIDGFTTEAEEKLLAHDWPGNVRELRNVLERAMIFAQGQRIEAKDLILLKADGLDTDDADGYFRFRSGGSLEDLEHEYIRHILTVRSNSSYADVARLLGISKKTLWEKRKKYNLDEELAEAAA
ncbi:MAG: helix-turn-helix domain-containing protein, partial [Bacteroidota bacterium]